MSSEDRNKHWKGYTVRETNDSDKVLVVDSFNDEEVDIAFDPSKEEEFLIVSFIGDEGDGAFSSEEDYCDLHYDIDDNFFEERDRKLLEFSKNSGIKDYMCSFGAGRND
jgi:hypothetical protein